MGCSNLENKFIWQCAKVRSRTIFKTRRSCQKLLMLKYSCLFSEQVFQLTVSWVHAGTSAIPDEAASVRCFLEEVLAGAASGRCDPSCFIGEDQAAGWT